MKWYSSDFGNSEEEMLHFLARYYPEGSSEQRSIDNFLSTGKFTVKYKSFDWSQVGVCLADQTMIMNQQQQQRKPT